MHEMFVLTKGINIRFGAHLEQSEIDCKCKRENCKVTLLSDSIIKSFYGLRDEVNEPLHINSGFRCQEHNKECEGKSASKHTVGFALDIKIPSSFTYHSFWLLAMKHFDGVVLYPQEGFVHCQNDTY
jgi:uncharacterized protein YcbK (DUF882 family)